MMYENVFKNLSRILNGAHDKEPRVLKHAEPNVENCLNPMLHLTANNVYLLTSTIVQQ